MLIFIYFRSYALHIHVNVNSKDRESEKDQRTTQKFKDEAANIKENFRFGIRFRSI